MTKDYYGTKPATQAGVDSGEIGYGVRYADGYQWMNFGHAIAAMKEGHKVARAGWNDKDMFIFLVEGRTIKLGDVVCSPADEHFDPSQTDILADDWFILDE